MTNTKSSILDRQQTLQVEGLPLGDTGDGVTGVPEDEQGISNRLGDRPDGVSAQADGAADDEDEDDDLDEDDEAEDDEEEDEDAADGEEDEDEEDVDEQTDPGSEPGKPV